MDPSSSKNKRKGISTKAKGGVAKKKKEKKIALKGTCFHCGQDGYWRKNCKAYLESLKKKASDAPFTSSMFVIEVNNVSNNIQWVFDTNCGSHFCTNVQELRDNM